MESKSLNTAILREELLARQNQLRAAAAQVDENAQLVRLLNEVDGALERIRSGSSRFWTLAASSRSLASACCSASLRWAEHIRTRGSAITNSCSIGSWHSSHRP